MSDTIETTSPPHKEDKSNISLSASAKLAASSLAKQQEEDDKIEWSSEHEGILIDWADKALCLRWLHAKSNSHYSRLNAIYTVPVIIMSTLTGTANFALDRFPTDYQGIATISIGSVNIIAGIITTISQFLKIAELNEAHRASAVSWSKLYRNIKLELAKAPRERKKVIHMLNSSKEEYDRLMETSPSISEKFIKLFKETFSGVTTNKYGKTQVSSIDKQNMFNSLNKPEVCDFIESTANSLYKAPPPPVPQEYTTDDSNDDDFPSIMSSNDANRPPSEEEMHKREIKQELRHQQQQVQDFNNRFQKEKQRKPTVEEVSNNFDNLIPLNIIVSVIEDVNVYNHFKMSSKESFINENSMV